MTEIYLDPQFEGLLLDQLACIDIEDENVTNESNNELLPPLVPREYQYELYKRAISENIIAVLDTGAGKTLISVMLIKHMLLIENENCAMMPGYKKKMTFFLVERVPLVFQQSSVIKANCDARVKELCGDMNVNFWKLETWREIFDQHDIFIMTAQIFLDSLRSNFLTLAEVNLIIFDECHHATKGHSFNLIMYEFYHRKDVPKDQLPKIFGMTASPIFSKASDIMQGVCKLETNLDARVYAAQDTDELAMAVKKPFEAIEIYSMEYIDDLPPAPLPKNQRTPAYEKERKSKPPPTIKLRYPRTVLTDLIASKIRNITGYRNCESIVDYISNNLGPWCSDQLWEVMLRGADRHGLYTPTNYTSAQKISLDNARLLREAYDISLMTEPIPDIHNEHSFTPKAQKLVSILKSVIANDNHYQNFCGIIFVERRHSAIAIKILIESLADLKDHFRCDILIGHGTSTGGDVQMKYHEQNRIINKFRAGELNLMIATNVAEEGLDIQACNYVIRFDISKVLIAYIQSRGRARKKNSKYMIMINSENKKEVKLIDEFRRGEAKMKEFCRLLPEDRNLATKFPVNSSEDIKQSIIDKYLSGAYTIPSTGALITLSNAIALIYHYCDCLPSDNFCNFKPIYEIKSITPEELLQDYNELIETDSYPAGNEYFYCKLTLPINACLKIVESIGRSKSDVKARVSLKACIALYRSGDIDENLIPKSKKQKKALMDNIEFDEEGKQVGSRGREQLYDKKMPSFWINEQKNMVDASFKFERGPYWISVFDIDMPPLESGNLRFRPMILITKKPLPDIPEIILFNDNSPFKVHVRSSSRPFLFEKDHHPQVLADYALAMMRIITNKEFQCQHMSDMAYFLAPLMRDTDTTTPSPLLQNKIDWSEVLNTICNNTKTYMTTEDVDDLEPNSQDTIVIDSSDQNKRRYIIQRIQYNMSPLSRVIMPSDASKPIREQDYETFAAYYQDRPYFKKEITDMNQPLLRVIQQRKNSSFLSAAPTTSKKEKEPESAVYWLIPELCQMYPVTASVYETLQVIPAIMTRIDAVLLLMDAKTTLNLKNIDMDFMLEAYTTSSAYMNKDYQRLEFFGDSVLKFITSTQVFVNYPKSREDELTELRGRMISNKALFRSAKELKLYQYIYSQNIPHRIWRPPNFTSPSDSAENIKRLTTHKLGDKTLADVIESTLGATYCSAGLQASLHTARQLRVPLHQQVHQMSDFHSVYQEQRQSQSIASQYDPSLRELDVRRVSEIVGYEFDDPSLIVEALTHASYVDSSVPCYQRLEFLGDAVLDFCVTKYLHDKYKTAQPSTLHSLKKSSVNNNILSVLCVQLQLHHHIRHVSSSLVSAVEGFNNSIKIIQEEGKDQGEYWLNLGPPKVLSDVIESVIGAVYVDSKFDVRQAEILFDRWLRPLLDKHISIELIQVHPFEKLQCLVKELGCSKYELKSITQPKSNLRSSVVFIHSRAFSSGSGFNNREAKKLAATNACQRLQDQPDLLASICDCRCF